MYLTHFTGPTEAKIKRDQISKQPEDKTRVSKRATVLAFTHSLR